MFISTVDKPLLLDFEPLSLSSLSSFSVSKPPKRARARRHLALDFVWLTALRRTIAARVWEFIDERS